MKSPHILNIPNAVISHAEKLCRVAITYALTKTEIITIDLAEFEMSRPTHQKLNCLLNDL